MPGPRDGEGPGASHPRAPVLHFLPMRGFSPLRKGDVTSLPPRQVRDDYVTAKNWEDVGAAGYRRYP
jgi:hypothetical protein